MPTDETTGKPGEGTPTSQATAAAHTAEPKKGVEYTPEQQAHLESLLKAKDREYAKTNKELATELEALRSEKKKREESELTELERVKLERDQLNSFKQKAEEYEQSFKTILEAKLAAIPEEKKPYIPDGLSTVKLLEWLEKAAPLLMSSNGISSGPTATKSAGAPSDPLLARAEEMVNKSYEHRRLTKDEREEAVKRTVDILKAQQSGFIRK